MDYVQGGLGNVWLAFRSLSAIGTKFLVLVAVPERDILGEARKERQRMAVVLAAGLVVGVGLAFWLASLYTRPISSLVHWSEAIQRLDLSKRVEITSRVSEVQSLSNAQARMSSALESFSRYVPRDVIAELLRQGEAARIGAHPAELTVLFTDIRHFTSISETLSPHDVALYLSEYFDVLHRVIDRHQGTTDKFIGDAIMAFWGAPRPDEDHGLHAVRAVLECRSLLDDLNEQWKAAGRPIFETTFGLASGSVVVGNVGATDRLNYTVLGNTVNVASRCVGLGRELGCSILALESVANATSEQIEWRRLGPVQVRGIRHPMMVCEPLGLRGQTLAETLKLKDDYERALDVYLNKDFDGALKILEQLATRHPDELSVQYLVRRCHELAQGGSSGLHTDMLSFT
jgi:adenylate cyclase